ncbi:MAG: TonB C-terminal domain-containing protein [Acidobacteriaceae bacterium]|jgi:protein TonB
MAGTYSSELLDQPDGIASPFFQSTLMHGLIVGLLIGYGYLHNMFHGSEWGANAFQQGAIQATLVSTAALPLPQDHPPTDNVLATETPSVAPALEEQKTEPLPLPEATPIPEKQTPVKPEPKPQPKTPPQHQPPPKPQNKANYGEAAPANVPRATANNNNANSPIAVTGGDFGSRFGWYVDVIKRKVAQDWYLQEVEPSTPAGATVFVQFTVGRDGSPGSVTLATPSSSPSLNSSCMHAVQRVDTFGPLPAGYNESSLNVLYHCTYPGTR